MYSVQELYSCLLLSYSPERILASISSSTFSVHPLTDLPTTFFVYLQVPCSKYSPASPDLSHPHSKSLGFQIDPLSHMPLSTNSLHSHLHLSLFQHCFVIANTAI